MLLLGVISDIPSLAAINLAISLLGVLSLFLSLIIGFGGDSLEGQYIPNSNGGYEYRSRDISEAGAVAVLLVSLSVAAFGIFALIIIGLTALIRHRLKVKRKGGSK